MSKLDAADPDETFDNDVTKTPPPHLAGLNAKQRDFVYAFVRCGNASEAAQEAGYGSSGKYKAQRGYELMHMEKIRNAITAEQLSKLHSLRSRALRVLEETLELPPSTPENRKLRLAAMKEALDRGGLPKTSKTETATTVTHQFENMPAEEIEAYVLRQIKASKTFEDVTFEEVKEAQDYINSPTLSELKGLPAPDKEQCFGLPDGQLVDGRGRPIKPANEPAKLQPTPSEPDRELLDALGPPPAEMIPSGTEGV